MKKLLTVLFIIAMLLSFTTGAIASYGIQRIRPRNFSEFNELRYMAYNVADEELHETFGTWGHLFFGLTNREEALELVDTVGRALIPVLPDLEGSEYRMEIRMFRDFPDLRIDRGALDVEFFYRTRGFTILFRSFYGYERRQNIWELERRDFDVSDPPTAVKNGIKYYQLFTPGVDDFVIIVDDCILLGWFRFYNGHSRLSDEEQLEILQQFSFIRLGDNDIEEQLDHDETNGYSAAWPRYVLFVAAGALVVWIVLIIVIKHRRNMIS
ncbi:MAG: hypothetical protein FWC96_02525 [Oscillospiraceae bacterium]|nr:hypothetical protein [Oscillospiraceae bacterium]